MSETANVNAGNCGVFDGDGRLIDGGYYMTPEARERAMEPIRAKLDRIENKLDRLLASVDARPKDGDSTQIEAPLASSAVGDSRDAQPSSPHTDNHP